MSSRKRSKTTKKDHSKYSCEYDPTDDSKFRASLSLGGNVSVTEESELDLDAIQHDGNLTYDDVEDMFLDIIDEKYPLKTFPEAKISSIEIYSSGADEWVPVLSESMKDQIARESKSKKHSRFLVLPDATYSLTPECKLWMLLKIHKILPEDSPFDYDAYSQVISSMREKKE